MRIYAIPRRKNDIARDEEVVRMSLEAVADFAVAYREERGSQTGRRYPSYPIEVK